jgi:hypothetical protein
MKCFFFFYFVEKIKENTESIGFVNGKLNFFVRILDEIELFNDKKVIFCSNRNFSGKIRICYDYEHKF